MDSFNIARSTFARKIAVPDPLALNNVGNSSKNNITSLEEVEELMGTTPYDRSLSIGDNVLAAIANGTFPTEKEVILRGLTFSKSEETVIPNEHGSIAEETGAKLFAVAGTGERRTSIKIDGEIPNNVGDIRVGSLDRFSESLFDKKRSSALKITNPAESTRELSQQIKKGWRWVTKPDLNNLIANAKTMPNLEVGDWVLLEGKTMRLIQQNSKAGHTNLLKYLEENCNGLNRFPPSLRINFSDYSYSRVAGAYIRHSERLGKLEEVFREFFEVTEKIETIIANLKGCTTYHQKYTKYKIVKLKEKAPITKGNVELLRQALGITIQINEKSTMANTIPLKKLLEIFTCFNPVDNAKCPWLVSLNIFGGEKTFLLSRGQQCSSNDFTRYQLLVSMLSKNVYKQLITGEEFPHYIGNEYSDWLNQDELDAAMILETLNNPVASSTASNDYWEKIMEFLVCTHVAESHCVPRQRGISRTPGAGKLTRAILRDHIKSGAPLSSSSFPMAGGGGTGDMRRVVEELFFGTKPYDDISDDSGLEEISGVQNVSGEGAEY